MKRQGMLEMHADWVVPDRPLAHDDDDGGHGERGHESTIHAVVFARVVTAKFFCIQ